MKFVELAVTTVVGVIDAISKVLKKVFSKKVDLTGFSNRELWMMGGIVFLTGVVFGSLALPKSITIGSNNTIVQGEDEEDKKEEKKCCKKARGKKSGCKCRK